IRDDLVKFYGLSPDKVDVCGVGFERPQNIDEELFVSIQKEYGIPEEYIIYSAQTWPHKNHRRLMRALKILHGEYGKKITLVCTGKKNEFFKHIEKEIVALNLGCHIIFTDYIREDQLLVLLKKA